MKDFLPSRKVIAYLLVPIVTFFGIWGVTKYYQAPKIVEKQTDPLIATLDEANKVFQERDTDGDGLKDWEEFLYQTDETIRDTDGDGLSDAAEIKNGQNPLVVGTGEIEVVDGQETPETGFVYYKDDTTLSRTDLLARDFLVNSVDILKADAVNSDVQTEALNQIIDNVDNVPSTITYAVEDIITVPNGDSTKRAYKNSYLAAASKTLSQVSFNEIELLARYAEFDDTSSLDELQKNELAYRAFAQELITIRVPQEVERVHLELLNNLLILSDTVAEMQKIDEDPVSVIIHSRKFLEDEQLLEKNLRAIALYLGIN